MTTPDTLPFAVFDEFGIPCDDRIGDYALACIAQERALRMELAQALREARQYVQEAPRDRYGDSYPECIDVDLLQQIDDALAAHDAAMKDQS